MIFASATSQPAPPKKQHEYLINECGVAKKSQSGHSSATCNLAPKTAKKPPMSRNGQFKNPHFVKPRPFGINFRHQPVLSAAPASGHRRRLEKNAHLAPNRHCQPD
ncbi:hypothetical protein [Rhodoblastus sp.]|uniref:hypothetical protein n=1 Tax=Rhodoblastus sp. TaxID=1962975 RepID=UPI003F9C0B24